jgi:hypothetical protein
MSRLSFRRPALSLAVAVGALALAACSDSPLSPTRSLRSSDASLSVTPGTNSLAIVSDGSTQYCASAQLNGGNNAVLDWNIPATFAPVAGCGTAVDLQLPAGTSALDAYNPGWSAPFTGSHWIGITTKGGPSSDYRPNPGRYVFQETFTIPANVTNASLDLHVKSDNVAAVYLNTTQIGAQANTDCNAGTCNWNSDLHLTPSLTANTAYTLTFVVADLPTGFPVTAVGPIGGPAPQYGCPTRPFQVTGSHLFTNDQLVNTSPNHVVAGGGAGTPMVDQGLATQHGCENPMGLNFAGTATWTPPPDNHGCTLGFWKTHTGLGPQDNAWPAPYVPGVTTLGQAGFTNTGNQNATMLDALSFSGGPTVQDAKNNLMKQAVAALLNAATPGMNYPLSVAQVLSQVNTALASNNRGTILALATTLEGFNSLEGPLC